METGSESCKGPALRCPSLEPLCAALPGKFGAGTKVLRCSSFSTSERADGSGLLFLASLILLSLFWQ